jgi:hypothetical protein
MVGSYGTHTILLTAHAGTVVEFDPSGNSGSSVPDDLDGLLPVPTPTPGEACPLR